MPFNNMLRWRTLRYIFALLRPFKKVTNIRKLQGYFLENVAALSMQVNTTIGTKCRVDSNFEIFGSNRCVFVRSRVGEQMISACVVPTVKHGRGGVMVWECFAGDTVVIYFEFKAHNQHGYHSILQWYAIPSGLCLVGQPFSFSTGQWPNTPPGCVRAIWPRRKVMECGIRWPGLHNYLTLTQLVKDELDRRVQIQQSTSAQHM